MKQKISLAKVLGGVKVFENIQPYEIADLNCYLAEIAGSDQTIHLQRLMSEFVGASMYYCPDFQQIIMFIQIYQPYISRGCSDINEKFVKTLANFAPDWPGLEQFLEPLFAYYQQVESIEQLEAIQLARLAANITMHYKDLFFLGSAVMQVLGILQRLYVHFQSRSMEKNLGKVFEHTLLWMFETKQNYWAEYEVLKKSLACRNYLLAAAASVNQFPEFATEFSNCIIKRVKELRSIDLEMLNVMFTDEIVLQPDRVISSLRSTHQARHVPASELLTKMIQANPCDVELFQKLETGDVVEYCKESIATDPYLEELLAALRDIGLLSYV